MKASEHTVLFASDNGQASLLTVCISLFNYGHYLIEALDSVYEQTLEQVDLVVVDDCSVDASATIARRWLEKHASRFRAARLLRHETNRGLAAARNTAFAVARTDLLFVLDADNSLYPRCLARCLEAIRASGAQFVYPMLEVFGGAPDVLGTELWSPERFRQGNYIDAMALVDRSAWLRAGGYSAMSVPGWEDYDLWCKFVECEFIGVLVPEILARYRVHPTSMQRTETRTGFRPLIAEMEARHPWLGLDSNTLAEGLEGRYR
jgi:glycosyltransferase involved in cell wall biosynthesis